MIWKMVVNLKDMKLPQFNQNKSRITPNQIKPIYVFTHQTNPKLPKYKSKTQKKPKKTQKTTKKQIHIHITFTSLKH